VKAASDFTAVPGHGIEATIGVKRVLLGNERHLVSRGVVRDAVFAAGLDRAGALAEQGKDGHARGGRRRYAGLVAVAEPVKSRASAPSGLFHDWASRSR
jgi:cation transport ATPase